jgi:hypothetical protein
LPAAQSSGIETESKHCNERDQLVRCLDDGRLAIDNYAAENAVRPFVPGRRNWLFSASLKSVMASANLYSLIKTAKAK